MSSVWQPFVDELMRWRDAGRVADVWWRDDDATTCTPELERLLALSASACVPLALAVIPQAVQVGLLDGVDGRVSILHHGVAHRNLALPGEKKSEFPGNEPLPEALARLAQGHARVHGLFGDRALPVLVPPWNRISAPDLLPALPAAGYRGLSRFGPRKTATAHAGLVEVNTHVDVIDWRGTRGFAGVSTILDQAIRHLEARRLERIDPDEPTGWLTHHAVHDEATWAFLENLLMHATARDLLVWRGAGELFA